MISWTATSWVRCSGFERRCGCDFIPEIRVIRGHVLNHLDARDERCAGVWRSEKEYGQYPGVSIMPVSRRLPSCMSTSSRKGLRTSRECQIPPATVVRRPWLFCSARRFRDLIGERHVIDREPINIELIVGKSGFWHWWSFRVRSRPRIPQESGFKVGGHGRTRTQHRGTRTRTRSDPSGDFVI